MFYCSFIFNVSDNIDTRTVMETLRDLVTSSNLYLRDAKPPNSLLLHDIGVYITDMLTIFGAIFDKSKIGFPVCTDDSRDVSKH